MNSLKIAVAFLKVPQLFVSLFLWPLLIGIGIAFLQISLSFMLLSTLEETSGEFQKRIGEESSENKILRTIILPPDITDAPPVICKPGDNCPVSNLDISLIARDGDVLYLDGYVPFFHSLVKRIHILKSCKTQICILQLSSDEIISEVHSLRALGVYHLAQSQKQRDVKRFDYESRKEIEESKELIGSIKLLPGNSFAAIQITDSEKTFLFVMNIALILLITLWLTLKAHKKILHYFSANGALLPLVAACGKKSFYRALWYLTTFRVFCFLSASIPASMAFILLGSREQYLLDMIEKPLNFFLWLFALISTITLAALTGSLMELKSRHSSFSFLYTVLPLSLAMLGTLFWAITLFWGGSLSILAQYTLAALPIVGVSPVILYPLVKMPSIILAMHSVLCTLGVYFIFKRNANWFSQHLGEI